MMGIYDRHYYREEQPGIKLAAPRSMVMILILINVALYLANQLITPASDKNSLGLISETLAVYPGTLNQPAYWWQFVTYGFVHSGNILHIFFNMLQLWFLGRAVEERYGRWEFLWVYLATLVVGSLMWVGTFVAMDPQVLSPDAKTLYPLVGASGAVCGVVLLFILNNPRATLVLFPIPIPIRAWILGVILIVMNMVGAAKSLGNVAYGVHLAGMGFAYVYFASGMNFTRLFGRLPIPSFKSRPKLRIHRPTAEDEDTRKREVDRILAKITSQGKDSLTRKELRTLNAASREYRNRQ